MVTMWRRTLLAIAGKSFSGGSVSAFLADLSGVLAEFDNGGKVP
jgi:hypothetical protein